LVDFNEVIDTPIPYPNGGKVISFSQLSLYNSCPRRWKLKYIDKVRLDKQSIHLVYGTAIHEILQTYLYVGFNDTMVNADKLNFTQMLRDKLINGVRKIRETNTPNNITKDQVIEYLSAGVQALEWFRKRRAHYFQKKNHELIGIETPIMNEIIPNVYFNGYIDLVVRDKRDGEYLLYDLKTSTRGWNKWDKRNIDKYGQLLLYKHYFMVNNDIPKEEIKKVKPIYFILKKELKDLSEYGVTDKHIQEFTPANGKIKLKQVNESVESFSKSCFTEEGKYNTNRGYTAVAGKDGWNCKFCPYKDRHDLCNPEDRAK
jgi:hypothetical protein